MNLSTQNKEFYKGLIFFFGGLTLAGGLLFYLLSKADDVKVDSQPVTVNLGKEADNLGGVEVKVMSAETKSKITNFKLLMAKSRTDDEDREMKFDALVIYNSISAETGQPLVIHLVDGVSFETALLNAVNAVK